MNLKSRSRQAWSMFVARTRRSSEKHALVRILGGRGVVALTLGAMLSLGGLTESLAGITGGVSGVHFLVEKDLDSVRVVRTSGGKGTKVVADVKDAFTANSIFKLSRILPDALVSQHVALFDGAWAPADASARPPQAPRDLFHEEMARINEAIGRDFFANAMPYGDLIHEKAAKYDVDPALVAAVIEQESRFRRTARSQVGARGLMQLMPRTGRWMGARDLYDPEQNVEAGVKYIKYLQERFDGNTKKAIAAYNAGEGNVMRYGGVPPFRETQTYVRKVMGNYKRRNAELKQYREDRGGGAGLEADGSLALR